MRAALDPFYWRFQILGWGVFCLLDLFYGLYLFDSAYVYFLGDYLVRWVSLVLASHLICLWTDYRGWPELSSGKRWIRVPVICMVAGLLCALPTTLLYWQTRGFVPVEIHQLLELITNANPVLQWFASGAQFGTKLLLWYLVVWMIYQQQVAAKAVARQHALELELQSTRLDNLQQQMKPHFMFNCLNSIRAMIHIDKDKSSEMVSELTHILRYSLQASAELVPLSEELKAVESYLSLEKARLGQRLTVSKRIDMAALEFPIPPLLLQTLVENAIRHGISPRARGGELNITASCEPAATAQGSASGSAPVSTAGLRITLRNDGNLRDETTGFGIGLKNSRQRLRLLYGREDLLQVTSEGDQVVSTLFVPAPSSREHG